MAYKKFKLTELETKFGIQNRLIDWLEQNGHIVYSYTGVQSVDEGILTGINPLSPETPDCIDLSKIDVCFLDHYFEGRNYDGTKLTKILAPLGIKVCGMSSVDQAHQSMMRVGAICSYRKDVLARMIRS